MVARAVAEEAAAALTVERAALIAAGTPPVEAGDRGDALAQEVVAAALARLRPDDPVLSEEAPDDPRRLDAQRVWIVDPLDGTRQFAQAHRPDWAVHVALVRAGRPVAGAVALPATGRCLATDAPPTVPPGSAGAIVVSGRRPPACTAEVAALLGADVIAMGSAGAKVAAVVDGVADAYVHEGGQHEWDSAAPVAVATASGLWCSRLDGRPLVYNRPDPWLPDLLICRRDVAPVVLRATGSTHP